MPPRPTILAWLATLAVLLLSANLRPGATSLGPVLSEVQQAFGLSSTVAGLLTALPGICFAIFGAGAVWVASRTGLNGGLLVASVATALGLAIRALSGDVGTFVAFTVLAFAGMAIGNVLVPAFIKRHFPNRPATMMALYSTGLAVGATVGSLIAAPLSSTGPEGWRLSLGVWGWVAALAAVPWLWLAIRERRHRNASHRPAHASLLAVAGSPKAVALGLFFGTQSMQAYVQFGWVAQMYRDGGLGQAQAGLMASLIALLGMPMSLVMPGLVGRLRNLSWLVVAFGALLVVGYAGILLAPTHQPWLWAVCLGLSGAAFPTALALITARTREHRVTAQLSGFTQSLGYSLAALGPFVVGWLHELSGGWTVPLLLLMGTAVVMVWSGLVAAAPGYVDDQLPT